MSRTISLNARTMHDAQSTSEIEVVLVHIEHPALVDPVRLSTDPTDRISIDPLTYGTWSTWKPPQFGDIEPYLFVLLSATLPDDKDDAPVAVSLNLEALDNRYTALFRSTLERATVSLAVVLASSPDIIEMEFGNLKMVEASGGGGQISMQITRDPIVSEPWPSGRMTRYRFPGLVG